MTTATPNYFSALFWRATASNIISSAANTALSFWILGGVASAIPGTGLSVPGPAVGIAALTGGLLGFLYSVTGRVLPMNTLPATVVPPPSSPEQPPTA